MRNRSVPYPQVHSTAIKLFAARPLFMAAQPFQQAKLLRMPKKGNKKSNISPELAKYCLKPRKTNTSTKVYILKSQAGILPRSLSAFDRRSPAALS